MRPFLPQVVGQRLREREETALGVVPRVRAELLVVRLERLHDPGNPELEVALGAVEGANHQIDDAEVEGLRLDAGDEDAAG